MATATALWSPFCAPADLPPQQSCSEAVRNNSFLASRSVGLSGRSQEVLCASRRRGCGEDQHMTLCTTQKVKMNELCGQLEELLKRAVAVGPSLSAPRSEERLTSFGKFATDKITISDQTDCQFNRDPVFKRALSPAWTPVSNEILDNTHNASDNRKLEELSAAAAQTRQISPKVDHFFKAGQICSRGENCSFAHNVRELKPLLVPPFRRRQQTTPPRSWLPTVATQTAAIDPPAATTKLAQSQVAPPAAAARALAEKPAACPYRGSPLCAPVSPSEQNGTPLASPIHAAERNAHAGDSAKFPSHDAQRRQQQFLSDVRRLSEATLEYLLAAVQGNDEGSSLSATAAVAAAQAIPKQPSASLPCVKRAASSLIQSLQRDVQSQLLSRPVSTVSPAGCSLRHVPPCSPDCMQEQQKQGGLQQFREGMEGLLTVFSSAQRSAKPPRRAECVLEASPQQQKSKGEQCVGIVAGLSTEKQRQISSSGWLSGTYQQKGLTVETAAEETCSSKQQQKQRHVMDGAAAAALHQSEERLWEKQTTVPVDYLWRDSRSLHRGPWDNGTTQTTANFSASTSVEAGSCFEHHMAAVRFLKKSRRGKRGGRKKRGAAHSTGGSGAEHQQLIYEDQKQQQQATLGEQQMGDPFSCVGRACRTSSNGGREKFLLCEVDNTQEIVRPLHRRQGAPASARISEEASSTSAVEDRTTAAKDAPAVATGTRANMSAEEAAVYSVYLKRESVAPMQTIEEETRRRHDRNLQLLLEKLHIPVAAMKDCAVRNSGLAVAAPSPVLLAAPANTGAYSSEQAFVKKEELTAASAAAPNFSIGEGGVASLPHGRPFGKLETSQQMQTGALHDDHAQQLLLQCVRDLIRQTPQALSASDTLTMLQLLNSDLKHNGGVGDFAPAFQCGQAPEKREEASGSALEENTHEVGEVENIGRTVEERKFLEESRFLVSWADKDKYFRSSFFADFDFSRSGQEKGDLNDRRRSAAATAAAEVVQGPAAVATVASILEFLSDVEEDIGTSCGVRQQQASTRSSSRCGVSKEEASNLLFGRSLATEAGCSSVSSRRCTGVRTATEALPTPREYAAHGFSPDFSMATTPPCFNPWAV